MKIEHLATVPHPSEVQSEANIVDYLDGYGASGWEFVNVIGQTWVFKRTIEINEKLRAEQIGGIQG